MLKSTLIMLISLPKKSKYCFSCEKINQVICLFCFLRSFLI
ncbi:hypothetical protein A1OE_709 [Candidatus Endolissoclinum faulkneri L2]|uniref:Uncharacterized protein n=1 Tax=Candidatus Endolissoclinum faulkneri L2 TaxID=1193729 RepID=K7YN22_9PROT|nr:hypothetical protein A1OE_709 [Candidatus Endolissoclinum faulkneri L2]